MMNMKIARIVFQNLFSHPCLFCLVNLLLVFPVTFVHSGTIELPQTGQITCYDAEGNPITCANTGQDGDFIAGVSWPVPRFQLDKSRACITDNLTGLMWSRQAWNLTSYRSWATSVLNPPTAFFQCGFSDWRLPNINELQSLVNFEEYNNVEWLTSQGFYFLNVLPKKYWSSTSDAISPEINAWNMDMVDGSVVAEPKTANGLIWPVRGTSNPDKNAPPGQIAETGQISMKATYDDAYYATPGRNVGVPWPDPRFTLTYCDATGPCIDQDADCDGEDINNIVKDNLTGLVWSANTNAHGLKTWSAALAYTNNLTTCGYGDWRLPNSKELFSIIDRSQSEPALPAKHHFINVQYGADDSYWASTSYAYDPDRAWAIDLFDGALGPRAKTGTAFVWPVRGGRTKPYVLTIKKEGAGKGKITATDLTCVGATCTGYYNSYEEITVTATPSSGSVFFEWTDCPDPSGNTCTITMTHDITVKATFLPEYKINVSPRSLNFKNLKQSVPSAPLTVTVKNAGVSPLQITSIGVTGDDASVFSLTPAHDCPAELTNLNDFCTVSVVASTDNYDARKAHLQISSNDPKKPVFTVNLRARAKPPKISKKPSALSFGKVAVGIPANKILTLKNKGITDLVIGVITIAGEHPGDFSTLAADTCSSSTLVTNGTCTVSVAFTPSVPGKRSAILQVPSNDPKRSLLSVNLKGTGG